MDTRLAGAYLDASKNEICFPAVFQTVKVVVRSNNIADDLKTTLKGWLKGPDIILALVSLSVLHTIAMNCSTAVRNILAGPRFFPRLEKQMGRPQSPALGTALAQMLLDWVLLYRDRPGEELGNKSLAALSATPKYRAMLDALGFTAPQAGRMSSPPGFIPLHPTPEAVATAEEGALGLPPVAPRRGPDFVRMFGSQSASGGGAGVPLYTSSCCSGVPAPGPLSFGRLHSVSGPPAAGPSFSGPPAAGPSFSGPPAAGPCFTGWRIDAAIVGEAITPGTVPDAVRSMLGHAAELEQCCQGLALAAESGRVGLITGRLDKGYVAAQRCSMWRLRVQHLTQTMRDEAAISHLLAAVDAINLSLQHWQHATTAQLRQALGPADHAARAAAAASSSNTHADLLGLDELFGRMAEASAPAAPSAPPALPTPRSQASTAGGGPSPSGPPVSFGGLDLGAASNPFSGLRPPSASAAPHNPFQDLLSAPTDPCWPPAGAAGSGSSGMQVDGSEAGNPFVWPPRTSPQGGAGRSMPVDVTLAHGVGPAGAAAAAAAVPGGGVSHSTLGAAGAAERAAAPSWVAFEAQPHPVQRHLAHSTSSASLHEAPAAAHQADWQLGQEGSQGPAGSRPSVPGPAAVDWAAELCAVAQRLRSSTGSCCPTCRCPGVDVMLAEFMGVMERMGAHHAALLRQRDQEHRLEISAIKAASVKRFKEMMQQGQGQQGQGQVPAPQPTPRAASSSSHLPYQGAGATAPGTAADPPQVRAALHVASYSYSRAGSSERGSMAGGYAAPGMSAAASGASGCTLQSGAMAGVPAAAVSYARPAQVDMLL